MLIILVDLIVIATVVLVILRVTIGVAQEQM
jgi:hypothetical protein